MVEGGAFRRDLYFRIAGAVLGLPPVRERSDVAGLVRHVFARLVASEALERPAPRLSRAAISRLVAARWPGNVRQIRTALQYALALAEERDILPEHLPRLDVERARLAAGADIAADSVTASAASEPAASSRLDELEHRLVVRALAEAGGNLSLAARRLGIARSTLYRHLRLDAGATPARRR